MISSMAEVLSEFIAELRGYNHISAIHRSGDEFYLSEIMCPLLREREIKSRGIAEICERFYHALKKQIFWFRLPRDNREKELEQHANHWLGVYEEGHEHDFPFTLLSGVQIHGEDIAPQQDNDNRRGMFPDDFSLFVGDVESMRGDWLPFNNYIFFVASFDGNLATENRNFDDYLAELKRKTEMIVEDMEPIEGADKRVRIVRRQDLGILAVPVFWYELSKKASEILPSSFEKIYTSNSQSGAIYWKTVRREVAQKLAGEITDLPGLTLRSLIGKPLKEFLLP